MNADTFAREIVESPEYRDSIRRRVASDSLEPAVEVMLIGLAFGELPALVRELQRVEKELKRRQRAAPRPRLVAFPLSADERASRISAAALAGDVEQVEALKHEA